MGTSKGYEAPTTPQWAKVKADITQAVQLTTLERATGRHPTIWMQPAEPWVSCCKCDDVLYDGDNHKALTSYRIKANGDAICSECDGDEASEFNAAGQEAF